MNQTQFNNKYVFSNLAEVSVFNQRQLLRNKQMKAKDGSEYTVARSTVVAVNEGKTVDVNAGVCRELCRMWLWARHNPTATEKLGQDAAGDKPLITPELALLNNHIESIMAAEAMVATEQASYSARQIAGLMGTSANESNLKAFIRRIRETKSLAMAGVGGHAIAFDARGDEFMVFDPNGGSYKLGASGADAVEFVSDFFDTKNYTLQNSTFYSPETTTS